MPLEILNLPIPDCLATRKLAGETVENTYQGNIKLSPTDIYRLTDIIIALGSPVIQDLLSLNSLTVGLIKPNAFEGRGLPDGDDEAAQTILELIDQDRVVFKMPFKMTPSQADRFYGSIKEKYSNQYAPPTKYHRPGVSIFDATIRFTASGPLTFLLLDGDNAIENWRNRIGKTNPEESDPSSIRGRHGLKEYLPNNLVHGSGSIEEARSELTHIREFLLEFYRQTRP